EPGGGWQVDFTSGDVNAYSQVFMAGRAVRGDSCLPATGQTTCWDGGDEFGNGDTMIPCAGTRQDGDLRKGAPLSYTDNGDGTISDSNTELQWEKLSMDGDALHDVGNHYSFASGLDKIANLNAAAFAGHTDWRLPNVRELESITDYGRIGGNG